MKPTFDDWLQDRLKRAAVEEGEPDEEYDGDELNEPARLIQERILEDYVRP